MLGSAVARVKLEDVSAASASATSVRFLVEQHGQDAAVSGGNGVRLIQFKYSLNARPIKPFSIVASLKVRPSEFLSRPAAMVR
jgi:hypothetical protein